MNELSEEMEMRKIMVIKSFVLFVVMILLNSCVSNAKRSVLTEMWGMIVDENNQPADNVLVGCKNEKDTWHYVMTDEKGMFVFKNVVFGKYDFTAEKECYLRLEENEVLFSDRGKMICFQMERIDSVLNRVENSVLCKDYELAKNLLSNLVLKKQHHLSLVEEYRKIIKKVEEKISYEQSEL